MYIKITKEYLCYMCAYKQVKILPKIDIMLNIHLKMKGLNIIDCNGVFNKIYNERIVCRSGQTHSV